QGGHGGRAAAVVVLLAHHPSERHVAPAGHADAVGLAAAVGDPRLGGGRASADKRDRRYQNDRGEPHGAGGVVMLMVTLTLLCRLLLWPLLMAKLPMPAKPSKARSPILICPELIVWPVTALPLLTALRVWSVIMVVTLESPPRSSSSSAGSMGASATAGFGVGGAAG